jgi:hypothetical protein
MTIATRYCPFCGERRLRMRDLTLGGLFQQAVHEFATLDARLLRSLRCLVAQPGALTLRYVRGPRKPYVGPLGLFLFANLVFIVMRSAVHSGIFSTPLAVHLREQPWSDLAQHWVAQHLATRGISVQAYGEVFDGVVATYAKSLVILMVPPLTVLLRLVFARQQRPFAIHAAFALHFHAFLLLLLSALLVVPMLVDTLAGGAGFTPSLLDNDGIAIVMLFACAGYLHVAAGRVYELQGLDRVIKTATLTALVMGLFLGYRFFLLLLTLWTT